MPSPLSLMSDVSALLAEAVERHHPRLVLMCSFQKEESVLIDMLMAIEPRARVFTIDTGALFPETYDVWRRLEDRYKLAVEVFDASTMNGPWSPENCCGPRKVEALDRAGFAIVATGLQQCLAAGDDMNSVDVKKMEKLFLSLA